MSWNKTDHAGIYRHETIDEKWRVRATAKNPVTGEMVERQRTLTDATEEDAVAARQKLKNEIRAAKPREDECHESESIASFAAQWTTWMKEQGRWNEQTYRTHEQILKDHILPRIGGLDADDLQRDDVRRWILYVEDKTYEENGERLRYSHYSLRRFWATMKHLIKSLYLEGYCNRRLLEWCRDVPGPKSDISGRRATKTLTLSELRDFVEAAKEVVPEWYPQIVTIAYTGMRYGESAGLDWEDLDFSERTIQIRRSFSKGRLGPPKTGTMRTVAMVEPVAEALEDQRERLMREQNLGLKDGIVFPGENGKRRWSSCIHDPMQKAAASAGIDVKVGPQVLRKTLVTVLDNVGVQRKMLKSIVGHQTDAMSDHYDEKRPEAQLRALDLVIGGEDG